LRLEEGFRGDVLRCVGGAHRARGRVAHDLTKEATTEQTMSAWKSFLFTYLIRKGSDHESIET
jgi:hypothetical protein